MNAYVAAGYGVTLATLAGYALVVLRRGRALSRAPVPERSGDRPAGSATGEGP